MVESSLSVHEMLSLFPPCNIHYIVYEHSVFFVDWIVHVKRSLFLFLLCICTQPVKDSKRSPFAVPLSIFRHRRDLLQMSGRTKASKKTEDVDIASKKRPADSVGTERDAKRKTPAKSQAVHVRRNIELLSPAEVRRYAIAVKRLKENSNTDPHNDWWNICSIHGGAFKPEVERWMKPLLQNYLEEYSKYGLQNSWTYLNQVDVNWRSMGFCAHGIPLFMIWHRVYMQCFEILLQHYDPEPDPNNPLMAHYWEWDNPNCKKLPDCVTAPTIVDYDGKVIKNPLLDGYSSEPNREFTIRGIPYQDQKDNISPFQGMMPPELNQAWRAFHDPIYSHVVTQNNGSAYSFEEPHNLLHNCVGGGFDMSAPNGNGDMTDVPYSSFDPIFWLHHANVERMHYAWIHKHHVPKHIYDNNVNEGTDSADNDQDDHDDHSEQDDGDKKDEKLDLINFNLWPFPSKDTLSYGTMPWKPRTHAITPSTPTQWLNNDTLSYTYENVTSVGHFYPVKVAAGTTTKTVQISNIHVRGSGFLRAVVRIGGKEFRLARRAIFAAPSTAPCPNCDARRMAMAWEVNLTQKVAKSNPSLELVSVTLGDQEIPNCKISWKKNKPAASSADA